MPLCRINLCRAALTILVVLLALAVSGCAVPGLGGKGAKTARVGGAGPDGGAGGPEDISAFSPEVSMQRDLLQLREREAGQRETVENMRMALRQGGEDVQREEERLRDIQMQIERYDSAMRRYEMAGRYALPADDRGSEGGEGGAAQAQAQAQAQARRGAAGRAGMDYGDNAYSGNNAYDVGNSYAGGRGAGAMATGGRPNGMPAGREEVLYAGAYDPRLAEQPAPVGDLTLRRAAGRATAQRRPMFEDNAAEGDVFAVSDAAAFAARPPESNMWNPPPAVPARPGAEQLAAVPGRVRPASGQPARPAARPAPPAAAAVEARAAVPEDDGMDEVFTPDLFLSRR